MYKSVVKRVLDFLLALAGTIVLSPLLLVLAAWVKLDSKGPVFFRQKRVGRDKRLFSILKFRSMYADTPHDVPTHLLQNPEAMITRSGRFLRRTSLDELPAAVQYPGRADERRRAASGALESGRPDCRAG